MITSTLHAQWELDTPLHYMLVAMVDIAQYHCNPSCVNNHWTTAVESMLVGIYTSSSTPTLFVLSCLYIVNTPLAEIKGGLTALSIIWNIDYIHPFSIGSHSVINTGS